MNINHLNYSGINTAFGQKAKSQNDYSTKDKLIVGSTTALGVAASLAVLSKKAGYSLKPSKMFKNITTNSYLSKVEYERNEIIGLGVGTCLGGLAGGYIIDKDANNRKAKQREAFLQFGNISIPILTVHQMHKLGKKYGKTGEAISSVAGVFLGVYAANFIMNKVADTIFHNKDGRKVKATDFSAHFDDMIVAASYVSKDDIVHKIGRVIPIALMIPGFEVGTKKAGPSN